MCGLNLDKQLVAHQSDNGDEKRNVHLGEDNTVDKEESREIVDPNIGGDEWKEVDKSHAIKRCDHFEKTLYSYLAGMSKYNSRDFLKVFIYLHSYWLSSTPSPLSNPTLGCSGPLLRLPPFISL